MTIVRGDNCQVGILAAIVLSKLLSWNYLLLILL